MAIIKIVMDIKGDEVYKLIILKLTFCILIAFHFYMQRD